MQGTPNSFWGKLCCLPNGKPITWHPLQDHCADVAACFSELLEQEILRQRLARIAGMDDFDQIQRARLGVLAALHDLGKYNTGFQSKSGSDQTKWADHVSPLLALFDNNGYAEEKKLCDAIHFPEIEKWGPLEAVFYLLIASISHHGQPVSTGGNFSSAIWRATDSLDPFAGMQMLFQQVQSWFPHAFQPSNMLLPDRIEFQHAFSGLVIFADWIGSENDSFLSANRAMVIALLLPENAPRKRFTKWD